MARCARALAPVRRTVPRVVGRSFSSSDVATVHPAEARAVKVLTGVLSTLLTPVASAAGTAAGKMQQADSGKAVDQNLRFWSAIGTGDVRNVLHSHPSLQNMFDDICANDKRATEEGFTLETMSSIVTRNGGNPEYAKVMMHVLDQDGDGKVTWLEFWSHHVVMEEDHLQDKVGLLLRGADMNGDGVISRKELSALVTASYLTGCSIRGKTMVCRARYSCDIGD